MGGGWEAEALGKRWKCEGNADLFVGTTFAVLSSLCGAAGDVLSRRAYEVAHATGEHIDGGNAGFQRSLGGLLLSGICLLVVKRRAFRVQANAPHDLVIAASKKKWRGVWPHMR